MKTKLLVFVVLVVGALQGKGQVVITNSSKYTIGLFLKNPYKKYVDIFPYALYVLDSDSLPKYHITSYELVYRDSSNSEKTRMYGKGHTLESNMMGYINKLKDEELNFLFLENIVFEDLNKKQFKIKESRKLTTY